MENKREIKFRAWSQEMDKMFYLHTPIEQPKREWIFQQFDIGFSSYKDDFELMQFTGLKDKNGKEIYEGDIVRLVEANRNYTVEWGECGFKLIHADPKLNRMVWGGLHRIYELDFTVEVIGNIYENPDLLK